ncbi:DUF4917 family protein [Dickeya zeae]|uniref:DUF4917 family protein n=1 Tax=Dickeya zeae TaxID=204042 RepID=UPI003D7F8AA8
MAGIACLLQRMKVTVFRDDQIRGQGQYCKRVIQMTLNELGAHVEVEFFYSENSGC